MRTLPLSLTVALSLFAFACDRAPEPRSEPARPQTVPLALSVDGPTTVHAGDELALKVTLNGHAPGDAATDLKLTMPAGVVLLDGAEASLPLHAGETRLVHVRVDTPPDAKEPLIATASLQGDGFGITSRGHYRFGNAAPKLAQPKLFKRN